MVVPTIEMRVKMKMAPMVNNSNRIIGFFGADGKGVVNLSMADIHVWAACGRGKLGPYETSNRLHDE
jgi:hypothetical protein